MRDDIIRDCVRLVARTYPETRDNDLLQLELALRRKWGGTEVYIKKRCSAERERQKPSR